MTQRAVRQAYDERKGTTAVGCTSDRWPKNALACVVAGLGPGVIARCCVLLARDYDYWAGGLPDLVVWNGVSVKEGEGCIFTSLEERE